MTAGSIALPRGGRLAYTLTGAGPPLLLIRPLGGTMALWGEFHDHLAATHRVLAFDHRGVGDSTGRARVSTKALARDALVLLDRLAITRTHVFGISLGGMTATWLAALAPDRVDRLCLASTPVRGAELTRAGLLRGLSLAACLARDPEHIEPCLIRRIASPRFRETKLDALARIDAALRAAPTPRSTLLRLALAGARHDARRLLPRITARALDLVGADDPLLGPAPGCGLAAAIPGCTRVVLPDTGHDLTLERPLATAERLAEFLAG